MRILQVFHFSPQSVGGTELYTYALSLELSKRHEVYVLYPVYGGLRYKFNFLKRDGLNLCELHIPLSNKVMRRIEIGSTYHNAKVDEKFRELLDKIQPDCIHFQHLVNLSASLIEVANQEGIPTVLTLHDYWFICPTTNLFQYNSVTCDGPDEEAENCFGCWTWREAEILSKASKNLLVSKMVSDKVFNLVLMRINQKRFGWRKGYLKLILQKVDQIIAPSVFLRDVFIKFGIPETKIVYSENGYDLNLFNGFKKKNHKEIVFGFVGSVVKPKGVEVLVEAFNKIDSETVELRIYGNYKPMSKFFKSLKTKSRNKNVRFMGRFTDLKNPFSEIDILIVPSIWFETGGPLVVKEAFAAGIPVIASNIGCIPEFVKDKVNGLLFKAGDPNDLREKIRMIVDDASLIAKLKTNIILPRSIEDQAKEIEELYMSIL